MAKYTDEDKYRVMNLLHGGKSFNEVSAATDIPLSTVLRWNKELKDSMANGMLNDMLDMDRVVLGEVIERVSEEPNLREASGKLVESLDYANRLNQELQLTALTISSKAKMFASSADNSSELIALSEVICQLQVAFFNSNSTQVNIQNNMGTGYEEFLTDAPAA